MLREPSPDATRRPAALADAAFEQLRADLIANGPLTADGRLVAGDLAATLGMSRTPVREALDRLGRLGYLEPLEGGGYQRRRYRMRDVRDLLELRQLLEPVGAALAASRRGRVSLADDRSFHASVAHGSGNRVLAHVVALLAERGSAIETMRAHDRARRPRARVEDERSVDRATVADAIGRGDGPAALQAMANHLASEARGLLPGRTSRDAGVATVSDE